MQEHARRLKERVQPTAVCRHRRQRLERACRHEYQREEERRYSREDDSGPRDETRARAPRAVQGDRREHRQHDRPQQQ
jgi:hypothetical protein